MTDEAERRVSNSLHRALFAVAAVMLLPIGWQWTFVPPPALFLMGADTAPEITTEQRALGLAVIAHGLLAAIAAWLARPRLTLVTHAMLTIGFGLLAALAWSGVIAEGCRATPAAFLTAPFAVFTALWLAAPVQRASPHGPT